MIFVSKRVCIWFIYYCYREKILENIMSKHRDSIIISKKRSFGNNNTIFVDKILSLFSV